MTSTRSAAATGLPSNRRGFITSLAAAGLLTGSAALAAPDLATDHPDAELIEIDALLAAAVERRGELAERCDEAWEGYKDPELPECLFWRKQDFPTVWVDPYRLDGVGDNDNGGERFTYASDDVLTEMRAKLARWAAMPSEHHNFIDRDVARVEEIVAAIEAWDAEVARRLEACGQAAAGRAHDKQCELIDELYERLARIPARTGDGVCIKTRAALTASHRSADLLEQHQLTPLLARTERPPGEMAELLSLSAMIDAVKLGAVPSSDRRAA